MYVRWMKEEDRLQVIEIYRQGIEDRNATFETTIDSDAFWNAITQCERFVLIKEDSIVGWGKLSRISERTVYSGIREVSIYVERSVRGKGGGRLLLETMVHFADTQGIWTLQSQLFPENEVSRRLHERLGFELVGRRRAIARHHGVWRDVLLLERRNDLR